MERLAWKSHVIMVLRKCKNPICTSLVIQGKAQYFYIDLKQNKIVYY